MGSGILQVRRRCRTNVLHCIQFRKTAKWRFRIHTGTLQDTALHTEQRLDTEVDVGKAVSARISAACGRRSQEGILLIHVKCPKNLASLLWVVLLRSRCLRMM